MAATAVDYARLAFDVIDEFDRLVTADQVMARFSTALAAFGYTAMCYQDAGLNPSAQPAASSSRTSRPLRRG
jgi:hypothetical protein